MFGLTTLQQLIRYDPSQSNIIMNAPWSITDYPKYKHRGVMLDPSRNFLSVAMIKQVLNGMALNKLNVLHLHLIDAQSFPFYSKSHPELSAAGAYSKEKIYQPSNLTDIVSYARNLGIRVIAGMYIYKMYQSHICFSSVHHLCIQNWILQVIHLRSSLVLHR